MLMPRYRQVIALTESEFQGDLPADLLLRSQRCGIRSDVSHNDQPSIRDWSSTGDNAGGRVEPQARGFLERPAHASDIGPVLLVEIRPGDSLPEDVAALYIAQVTGRKARGHEDGVVDEYLCGMFVVWVLLRVVDLRPDLEVLNLLHGGGRWLSIRQ